MASFSKEVDFGEAKRGRRPDVPLKNSDLRSVGLSGSPTPTRRLFIKGGSVVFNRVGRLALKPPQNTIYNPTAGCGHPALHRKVYNITKKLAKVYKTDASFYHYICLCFVGQFLFNKAFAAHLCRLFKVHNLEHCGSDIAKLAALFKLAGITHNDKGNGVCCVSGEG